MVRRLMLFLKKFVSSLSFKLSFYASLIMFVALLIFSYHSISAQKEGLIKRMIRGAVKDSEVIKAAIWNGMMANDREVIRQILETVGKEDPIEEINVYDSSGRMHYTSRPGLSNTPTDLVANLSIKSQSGDSSIQHWISDDKSFLQVVNPLVNSQSCSTAACHAHPESERILGFLEVKVRLRGLYEEIGRAGRRTITFAVALFILISTISGLAVIFLVNPGIRKLQARTARMARGEYRPREPRTGTDEMADLERAFDEMSRQINERTAQLEASRKMYKALFDEVPCYLTVVDRDYRIVRSNHAFAQTFGDQRGKHCFIGYKGLTSRCKNCPVEKTFADGWSHQSEEVWSLEGQKVYVMVKTSPILDERGYVAEVLEMSVDVTRLKQLQLELAKKEQEYRYLFENAPCYITVVDPAFNIVQTNKLFDRDFGACNGRKCYQVYKKRDQPCDDCPVEKTFADGGSHQSEELWRRDGEDTYVLVQTAPITDENGQVVLVMEMSTNITETKRLQGELVVLGETIAGMSHTIKNILCGLQGGVYVVDSGLVRGRDDRVRTGWQMVKNNVEKVSDLVRGILYASKERKPEHQIVDPATILEDVCSLYEARTRTEGIELIRAFQAELGLCSLDPAGIHSALSNLVSNALEACRKAEGPAPRTITVVGRREGGTLIFQVIDNGAGMPREVKRKLFNKFFSTKGAKGTGLGLVITRKVVEEHRGTMRVESEPGKGTAFTIEIPITDTADENIMEAIV